LANAHRSLALPAAAIAALACRSCLIDGEVVICGTALPANGVMTISAC